MEVLAPILPPPDATATAAPRVLYVDHAAVLGGAELSLLDVARRSHPASGVLLFADGPFRERLTEAGVSVEVLPADEALLRVGRQGGLLAGLRAIPAIFNQVRQVAVRARGYDLVVANSQKAFVVAALAGPMARRPVVWYLRDVLTADHFSPINRKVAVALANWCAALVLCNSAATAEAFVAAGGRADLARVVLNGIDPAPFEAVTASQVARCREDLGIGAAPVVGVFSRLADWKGQHVLLEALETLPGVHALLVGDAIFEDDKAYAAALRERAAGPALAGRVHFLGFRNDVPVWMRLCDIITHTSVAAEPFGRVIVEGMLAGRPVVATRAGGALEILNDPSTGRLVPPSDAAALRAALTDLLSNPTVAQRLAASGQQAAYDRFTVDTMSRAVQQHLARVLAA